MANPSIKFEDPKAIHRKVVSFDVSHRILLTLLSQKMCMRWSVGWVAVWLVKV